VYQINSCACAIDVRVNSNYINSFAVDKLVAYWSCEEILHFTVILSGGFRGCGRIRLCLDVFVIPHVWNAG